MKRKQMTLLIILLDVAWVALAMFFSSQNGSDSHGASGSVARFLAGILYPGFSSASSIRQT